MIQSLKVVNLNGCMNFDLRFHEDINIITGKNGSGKTTILKLLWYAISGNLERILPEIDFEHFELVTEGSTIQMSIEDKTKQRLVKLKYKTDTSEKEIVRPFERGMDWEELQGVNRLVSRANGPTIFFPTFRRIEGGFSIYSRLDDEGFSRYITPRSAIKITRNFDGERLGLQQAVHNLSERLSVGSHRFIASISTDDIVRLVTSKYAEISEKTNRLHMELSRYFLDLDRVGSKGASSPKKQLDDNSDSQVALEDIRQRAKSVTQQTEDLLRPFTLLTDTVAKVLQYKGIKLAEPVTLGEAKEAIASDVLSAGEKQMLSFLCYNAFARNASLFIDEPEISLHVDWQRILFPILLEQSTGNQFIVATHSPFIYSKYADKELNLAPDRGDADANSPIDGNRNHQLPWENVPADAHS